MMVHFSPSITSFVPKLSAPFQVQQVTGLTSRVSAAALPAISAFSASAVACAALPIVAGGIVLVLFLALLSRCGNQSGWRVPNHWRMLPSQGGVGGRVAVGGDGRVLPGQDRRGDRVAVGGDGRTVPSSEDPNPRAPSPRRVPVGGDSGSGASGGSGAPPRRVPVGGDSSGSSGGSRGSSPKRVPVGGDR